MRLLITPALIVLVIFLYTKLFLSGFVKTDYEYVVFQLSKQVLARTGE